MIFETHAHINSSRFDTDREETISRIKAAGVDTLINVGDSIEGSKESVKLAMANDMIYAAVGIHPESAGSVPLDYIDILRDMASYEKVVAIGEIGLDYYWEENPDADIQKKVFGGQLSLARELCMPVIIHSREACEDTFNILRDYFGQIPVVYHCFSYSPEFAEQLVKYADTYIGVGGVVTFKNAKKLVETVRRIPVDRILLETDCPYMAPEPHRGKRNDSSYLPIIASKIAEIKDLSPEEVCGITHDTAGKIFMKKQN